MRDTLFTNLRLVTADGGITRAPEVGGEVAVSNGVIVAVGEGLARAGFRVERMTVELEGLCAACAKP